MNVTISVPALLLATAAVSHRCVPRLVQSDSIFPFLPLTVALASTSSPKVPTGASPKQETDRTPPTTATRAATTTTTKAATATATATSKLLRYRDELRIDEGDTHTTISADLTSRDLRAVRRVIIVSGVSYQKLVSVVAPAIAAGVDLPLDSVEAPWPLPTLPASKVIVTKRDSMVNGKADDAAWTAALSMTTELDLGHCTVDHGARICALAPRLTSLSFTAVSPTRQRGQTNAVDCFFRLPAPRPALKELVASLSSVVPSALPLPIDNVMRLRKLHLSSWPAEGIVALITANAGTLEDLFVNFDGMLPAPAPRVHARPDKLTVPALPRLRRLSVRGAIPSALQTSLSRAVPESLDRLETYDVDWAAPPQVRAHELISTCRAFFARPRPDVRVLGTSTEVFLKCTFSNLLELRLIGEELSSGWATKLSRRCPPSLRVLSVSTNGEGLKELKNLTGLPGLRSLTVKVGRSSMSSARDCVFRDVLPFPNLEHLTVSAYDDTDYYGDAMGGFDDGRDEDPSCPTVPSAEDFSAMLQRHPRLLEVTLGSSSYGTAQREWKAAWSQVEARAVPPNRPLLLTLRY